jgi:hypothetical protein
MAGPAPGSGNGKSGAAQGALTHAELTDGADASASASASASAGVECKLGKSRETSEESRVFVFSGFEGVGCLKSVDSGGFRGH